MTSFRYDKERPSIQYHRSISISILVTLTLSVSFVYGYLHLLPLKENNWNWKDAVIFTSYISNDSYLYLAMIKEVYEGNYDLSNAFLAEYKEGDTIWPKFPFYLTAFVGKVLHLPVQHLVILMDFTLPAIIFLFAYALLYTVSAVRSISLVGAVMLILTPRIIRLSFLSELVSRWLHGDFRPPYLTSAHILDFQSFSRTINPQLTYLFLLMALFGLLKGIVDRKKGYVAFGIITGIFTSYSYPYFSTYLYVVLGLVALTSIYKKDVWSAKASLVMLGSVLVVSLPFWLTIFTATPQEAGHGHDFIKTHVPIVNIQLFVVLIFGSLIFWGWIKGWLSRLSGMIAWVLLFGGLICAEQHVVTGLHVQPWHYLANVIPQALIFSSTLVVAEYVKKPKARLHYILPQKRRNAVIAILIIYLVFDVSLGRYTLYSTFLKPTYGYLQTLEPAVRWLNAETEKESVILGSLEYGHTDGLISMYTQNNLYMSEYAKYYAIPDCNELRQRFYIVLYFMGIRSQEDYYYYLTAYQTEGHAAYFYMDFCPPSFQEYNEYQPTLKENLYSEMTQYQVDYLFYGPMERRYFKLAPDETYTFLRKLYDDGVVAIYRIL